MGAIMRYILLIFISFFSYGMETHRIDVITQQVSEEFPGHPAKDQVCVEQFFAQISNASYQRQSVLANVNNNSGEDIVVDIKDDIPRTTETPDLSNESEDTITVKSHRRRVVLTNGATAVVSAMISAGVVLAIHFTECKK